MKTQLINIQEDLTEASKALKEGKLVVFPTETVYGLGANALNDEAVDGIFKAKGRPSDNPLIVHIASINQLEPLVKSIPEKAKILIDAFWPGPITLIFNKSARVPYSVTAGLSTVAIRMPDNPIALELIEQSGVPVAAPSANLSGKPSPTRASHVIEDLMGRVDYIVDGGNCRFGLESTVLDVTCEPPVILRPGSITREMIEEKIGPVGSDNILEPDESHKPKSPGMKYRHYAPQAEMMIVLGESSKVVETINSLIEEKRDAGVKTGVMSSYETKDKYRADLVLCPGSEMNMEDLAARIYSCLREFDEAGAEVIFSEGFSENGLGRAVMNRLKKAAGGRIIKV